MQVVFLKASALVVICCSLASAQWQTQSGTNNIYYNAGNVGIGTATPSSTTPLTVSYPTQNTSTTTPIIQMANPSGAGTGQSGLAFTFGGTEASKVRADSNGSLVLSSKGTQYIGFTGDYAVAVDVRFGSFTSPSMIIQGGGNVGIGTTSPGQKLSVAGTVESTSGGFKFPDGTTQSTAAGVPVIYATTNCGAVANDGNDYSSALSSCIAPYLSSGTGVTVVFPVGVVGVCDLDLNYSSSGNDGGVRLVGQGAGSGSIWSGPDPAQSTLKYVCTGGAGHYIVRFRGSVYPGIRNSGVEELNFDGAGKVPNDVIIVNAYNGTWRDWSLNGATGYALWLTGNTLGSGTVTTSSTSVGCPTGVTTCTAVTWQSGSVFTSAMAGQNILLGNRIGFPGIYTVNSSTSITLSGPSSSYYSSPIAYQAATASGCGSGGGFSFVDNLLITGYNNNSNDGRSAGGILMDTDVCSWHFGKLLIANGDRAHGILMNLTDSNVFMDSGIFSSTNSPGIQVSSISCTSGTCTVNTSEAHNLMSPYDGVFINNPCSAVITNGVCTGTSLNGLKGPFVAHNTGSTQFTVIAPGTPDTPGGSQYYAQGVYQSSVHLGDGTVGSQVWSHAAGALDTLYGVTSTSYDPNALVISNFRMESGGGQAAYYRASYSYGGTTGSVQVTDTPGIGISPKVLPFGSGALKSMLAQPVTGDWGSVNVLSVTGSSGSEHTDFGSPSGGFVWSTQAGQQMALSNSGTLTLNNPPTSGGGGGLYLCVDSSGTVYKKVSCP